MDKIACIEGLKPEVYFKPTEVWEIRGAESALLFHSQQALAKNLCSVTLSPVSVASMGLISDSRGLSLRFPRFIRVREDKNIEQASTSEFLANMWKNQQGKQAKQNGADEGDLVDVDFEEVAEEEYSDS